MISKLLLKSSLFGSVGSGAYISTVIHIDIPDESVNNKSLKAKISDTQKKDFSTQDPKNVTLEVVEMFEKDRGCKIVYAESFENNKNYSAKGWFEKKMKENSGKEKDWKYLFADGLVYQKGQCFKGEILVLELQTNSFKPKMRFKL